MKILRDAGFVQRREELSLRSKPMGIGAVKSHKYGDKHTTKTRETSRNLNISSFLDPQKWCR